MHPDVRNAGWRWTLRLLAGAFAGLVGGSIFGVVMAVPGILNQAFFGGTGMWTLISQLFLTGEPGGLHLFYVWLVHAAMSILFGVAFSALVPPSLSYQKTVPIAMGYGAILWLVGPFLLLRTLAGLDLALDWTAAVNLVGHLLYGATLGLVYPAFEHEEERTAEGYASFRYVPPRE